MLSKLGYREKATNVHIETAVIRKHSKTRKELPENVTPQWLHWAQHTCAATAAADVSSAPEYPHIDSCREAAQDAIMFHYSPYLIMLILTFHTIIS